jgi:hypothetical protein
VVNPKKSRHKKETAPVETPITPPLEEHAKQSHFEKDVVFQLKQIYGVQIDCCKEQVRLLNSIVSELEHLSGLVSDILTVVSPRPAVSATLTLTTEGDPDMPATIHINGNGAQATFTEFDQANGIGNEVPPIGPVVFSSSDNSVATVDPSSGLCAAVAVGSCSITGTDQGNSLTASDTLTVMAATAVSAKLTLQAL